MFRAYRDGRPVVLWDTDKEIIHGAEEMKHSIDGMLPGLVGICGIDKAEWEATDCPRLCEEARLLYYIQHHTAGKLDPLYAALHAATPGSPEEAAAAEMIVTATFGTDDDGQLERLPLWEKMKTDSEKAGIAERDKEAMVWDGCPEVEIIPGKVSGAPMLVGTRMDAAGVILNYQDGLTAEEIAEDFRLGVEQVRAVIDFWERNK